jgi:hypothetical protein
MATLGLAVAVPALAARPTSPPPKVTGVKSSPPPAWVEVGTRSVWAAFGSYCWKTACVDMLPPSGRPDLPSIRASRGTIVRLRLAFTPRSATVTIAKVRVPATVRLRALTWHARVGIADIHVKGPGGSASYLVRLR